MPSMAYLTVSLFLCSSRSNAQGVGLKATVLAQKALQGRKPRQGSCLEEWKGIVYPRLGLLICTQGKLMIFDLFGPPNI